MQLTILVVLIGVVAYLGAHAEAGRGFFGGGSGGGFRQRQGGGFGDEGCDDDDDYPGGFGGTGTGGNNGVRRERGFRGSGSNRGTAVVTGGGNRGDRQTGGTGGNGGATASLREIRELAATMSPQEREQLLELFLNGEIGCNGLNSNVSRSTTSRANRLLNQRARSRNNTRGGGARQRFSVGDLFARMMKGN